MLKVFLFKMHRTLIWSKTQKKYVYGINACIWSRACGHRGITEPNFQKKLWINFFKIDIWTIWKRYFVISQMHYELPNQIYFEVTVSVSPAATESSRYCQFKVLRL